MVTAVILINVDRPHINAVAEDLVDMNGVAEVYSVSGGYDLIVIVRVRSNEELADLVTSQISRIEPIINTETHLAFKTYSRHDLEAMFSLGNDEDA